MANQDRYTDRKCWIDIFDRDHFLGTLHRIFGPVDLPDFHAASIIVGPGAHLRLAVKHEGKENVMNLEPNSLVPDFPALLKGVRILKAAIEPVLKVTTTATAQRRRPQSQSARRRQ